MAARVRISHSAHGAANAALAMAIELDLCGKRGLGLVPTEVANTAVCVADLVAGRADVAGAPGVPILRAAAAGADLVVILSAASENNFAVVGAPGVSRPDDLIGGVLGTVSRGDQDYIVLQRSLRDWGIDPDTDVTIQEFGNRGAKWDALLEGRIRAFASSIPQPFLARKRGLTLLRDYLAEHRPYQLGSMVTTRRYAEDHRAEIQLFLEAMLEAYELFRTDFDLALPFLKARSKLDDIDVLRSTHQVFSNEFENFAPRVEPLMAVAADLESMSGSPLGVDVHRMVDASYLPRNVA